MNRRDRSIPGKTALDDRQKGISVADRPADGEVIGADQTHISLGRLAKRPMILDNHQIDKRIHRHLSQLRILQ
jgi:hypothetical protein